MSDDRMPSHRTGSSVDVSSRNGHSHGDPAAPRRGSLAPPLHEVTDPAGPVGADKERKSVATVLVDIAHERYDFALSTDGDTFAIPKHGPLVVSLLRGGKKSLRAQLAREYFTRTSRTASQQALAEALLVIEGTAQEGDELPLHLRVARHGDALWLDLGDHTGTAVKVTGDGWSVESVAAVHFRRTALTAPLPTPVLGGTLDELWQWLNVEPPDRPLLAAWLVAALRPDTPHPALGLFGEQGTGKTTAMKLVVSTIDASPVPARKPPRDPDSWVTAASASWIVGLDNLSEIPPWLSDSICRAVTGDGDVRRRLYTDADLAVFAFRRCVVFNGIDLGGLRGDLADRLVPIQLHRITDTDRLDEEQLWPAWTAAQPRILGALLDLAAAVMLTLPTVTLASRPRMADFARIIRAVDTVLGTNGLEHYLAKQGALATDSLSGDDFVAAIRRVVQGTFTGTAAELLRLVVPDDTDWRPPKSWPSNARAVTTRLRRQAPVMRKAGWQVDDGNNRLGITRWTITPPNVGDGPTPAPPDPRPPRRAADQAVLALGTAGNEPAPAAPEARADPRPTRAPRPVPRSVGRDAPGQRRPAGHAGHAGHASAPPSAPAGAPSSEQPCTDCGAPATDPSGLCAACTTARALRKETPE
jgi:hypothetical protein